MLPMGFEPMSRGRRPRMIGLYTKGATDRSYNEEVQKLPILKIFQTEQQFRPLSRARPPTEKEKRKLTHHFPVQVKRNRIRFVGIG